MDERLLKNINLSLIFIVIFLFAVALFFMRDILVPFVFSIFIYTAAVPAIDYFEDRLSLPRALSAILVFTLFVFFSAILVVLISDSIEGFYTGGDIYRDKVNIWIIQVEKKLIDLGILNQQMNFQKQIQELGIFSTMKSITKTVANFFSSFFLVMLFAMFLIFGSTRKAAVGPLFDELQLKISKYLVTKTTLSFVTGILVWIVLSIARVDLAFMFALLTILLNFIPSIGSMVATILPVPIVLLQFGFGWQFWFVFCACGATQFIIGNVLEPKIMGNNLDLHPVTILLFLIFWGQVWGLPGMFLAVPITAILKIILSRIEETKFLADLLAGRLPQS